MRNFPGYTDPTEKEWEFAEAELKDKPLGTKLKRSDRGKPINYTFQRETMHLQHSYLVIPNESGNGTVIVALAGRGKYLGKGGFAKAKLAVQRNQEVIVLKTESNDNENSQYPHEEVILQKLGIGRAQVHRETTHIKNGKPVYKIYKPMKYLGVDLITYFKKHPALTLEDRLDIAIKIALAIEKLHKEGYAHLDIKPANIVINSKGEVNLIDFGTAEADVDGVYINIWNMFSKACTPRYFYYPSIFSTVSKLDQDRFSFLKTLNMPIPFWPEEQHVFQSSTVMQNPKLQELVDTWTRPELYNKPKNFTQMAAFLILIKNKIYFNEEIIEIPGFAELIVKQYNNGTLNKNIIDECSTRAKTVNKLTPLLHHLNQYNKKNKKSFKSETITAFMKYMQEKMSLFIENEANNTFSNLEQDEKIRTYTKTVMPLRHVAIPGLLSFFFALTFIGAIIGAIQYHRSEHNQFLFFKRRADSADLMNNIIKTAQQLSS